jgi:hypothetical protein
MEIKRLRLDFAIAICALLISTIAAFATVYQTHVIARQFSATVWPYVSFDRDYSPWSVSLIVRNDGLGPAIVRSVSITWNGKNQSSIEALLAALQRSDPAELARLRSAIRSGAKIQITTSTPRVGMVIPANSQHTLIRFDGTVLVQYFRPKLTRFGFSLCYCSLTGSCWSARSDEPTEEPKSVASCARSG